jgi:hypothetical protein
LGGYLLLRSTPQLAQPAEPPTSESIAAVPGR